MGFYTQGKARQLGAWSMTSPAAPLWDLSKRELIEIALHLASLLTDEDDADEALRNGAAAQRVLDERYALKRAKLI